MLAQSLFNRPPDEILKTLRYLVLDYETYSDIDLLKRGAYEYSQHKSTEILCAAWKLGTFDQVKNNKVKTELWASRFKNSAEQLAKLVDALLDPKVIVVAHNAFFEQVITRYVLSRYVVGALRQKLTDLKPQRFFCTAAMAASHAIPRNLEQACIVLKLKVQKDMEGSKLIKKWCKPRKPTKSDPSTRHTNRDEFLAICRYCITDIEAEVGVFTALPFLNEIETQVWLLDQEINLRGILVDRDFVKVVLNLVAKEIQRLDAECVYLTQGLISSTTKAKALLTFLQKLGYPHKNMQAKTISDFLENKNPMWYRQRFVGDSVALHKKHDALIRRLLENRQKASKSSTAKYVALEMRTRYDSRIRDTQLYHAASTGRFGGRGFQPHNLPKGTIEGSTNLATDIIKGGDLEFIRMMYGSPMDAFSSCIRNALIPTEGSEFFVSDFVGIESRILFWVADHKVGLKAFHEGADLYKTMAMAIYKICLEAVTKDQRQVGKQAILGCGYQMGWKKFKETAAKAGVYISDELAQLTVKAYREFNAPVVKLWANMEQAAIKAVQNKGMRVKINHTIWFVENNFLYCELPSKRRLAYYGPGIKYEETPWGEMRPKLYHWGTDSYTKKWVYSSTYGGKLVENVVQAISRDLMAEAMLRIDKAGYKIVLTVHDEIIAENKIGKGNLKEFESLMSALPEWAKGAPVSVEGWVGLRYRK